MMVMSKNTLLLSDDCRSVLAKAIHWCISLHHWQKPYASVCPGNWCAWQTQNMFSGKPPATMSGLLELQPHIVQMQGRSAICVLHSPLLFSSKNEDCNAQALATTKMGVWHIGYMRIGY
jgi:hypothetical protein